MSYSKNTWANGDTITAAKMNHMESGIEAAAAAAGGAYKVTFSVSGGATLVADKTIAEIYAACAADMHVYAVFALSEDVFQRFEVSLYSATRVDFYAVQVDDDDVAAVPVCIQGGNAGADDTWTLVN